MYKKEIERKFIVDITKMPDLTKCDSYHILQGYLSNQLDLLEVRVRYSKYSNGVDEYLLIIKDNGMKVRNEMTYGITKEEFETSIDLCGNKIISKQRYLVPNSIDESRMLELDIYDNLDLVVCEYEAESIVLVDTLPLEKWFLKEVTNDISYKNATLAYTKIKK